MIIKSIVCTRFIVDNSKSIYCNRRRRRCHIVQTRSNISRQLLILGLDRYFGNSIRVLLKFHHRGADQRAIISIPILIIATIIQGGIDLDLERPLLRLVRCLHTQKLIHERTVQGTQVFLRRLLRIVSFLPPLPRLLALVNARLARQPDARGAALRVHDQSHDGIGNDVAYRTAVPFHGDHARGLSGDDFHLSSVHDERDDALLAALLPIILHGRGIDRFLYPAEHLVQEHAQRFHLPHERHVQTRRHGSHP
mmetsp:Transcript_725/g.1334  ORF Transcript_725/g.1334 Transcript_725/m.1334 type:complete len:252 (-) Transcript_725:729-1484(-)